MLEKTALFELRVVTVQPGGEVGVHVQTDRDKQWSVLTGAAVVSCDEQTRCLQVGESLRIQRGQAHRLQNATETPIKLVEAQWLLGAPEELATTVGQCLARFSMSQETILVVGGAGYIGSHMVADCLSKGMLWWCWMIYRRVIAMRFRMTFRFTRVTWRMRCYWIGFLASKRSRR